MYDSVWSEILRIRSEEIKNLLEKEEPKLEIVELHYENDESWINFINE